MSPFHRAQLVYSEEICKRDFWTDLHLHMTGGYVFSTPDSFVMGRPVDKDASYEDVTNPAVEFENPNAWLVYLAAGNGLSTFLKFEPYQLKWIGWERDNKLRWYWRETLLRKIE